MTAQYQHTEFGYNYRMTDISAAIGRVQLSKLGSFNTRRREIANLYNKALSDFVTVPENRRGHVFHQYTIRCEQRDQLQKYLGFLATVGSTAPFVGLFGTVWGIMNSFQSIAASKDTSLAVVAPGIAEALFATALGLVAAIPSVVAYNKLSGDLDRYSSRLESFGTEFRSLMSRQLEERST